MCANWKSVQMRPNTENILYSQAACGHELLTVRINKLVGRIKNGTALCFVLAYFGILPMPINIGDMALMMMIDWWCWCTESSVHFSRCVGDSSNRYCELMNAEGAGVLYNWMAQQFLIFNTFILLCKINENDTLYTYILVMNILIYS